MIKTFLSRRESIIISAIDIIDELGINELSLREIALRQDISDSAIYKHFKSKEEIILAVLEYYSRFDSNITNTVREGRFTPKEGIFFFIKSIVDIYESHPGMTAIAHSFEILKTESHAVQRVKEIFNFRLSFICELVEKGQKDGSISQNYNSQDLADTILGIERTITLRWRINNNNFTLSERIDTALQSLLDHCK